MKAKTKWTLETNEISREDAIQHLWGHIKNSEEHRDSLIRLMEAEYVNHIIQVEDKTKTSNPKRGADVVSSLCRQIVQYDKDLSLTAYSKDDAGSSRWI